MKVSYKWLNEYLNSKAPSPEKIANLLTMHSMEVEGIEKVGSDTVIDVKTLPNNSHSCLCHRGIAREVGVLIKIKPKLYSYDFKDFVVSETSKKLTVKIVDEKLCRRYIGRVVENVKVKESPEWLKTRLETLGQRSINNIVDATNFVMLEIGQPMHVFDADKLEGGIIVRRADLEEQIDLLSMEIIMTKGGVSAENKRTMTLNDSNLIIADDTAPLALAGIKGGIKAELKDETVNIVLESANFDPVNIRRTATALKMQTDATKRYENDLTPEIASEAMDILTKLIIEIAGTKDTKVGEAIDKYPRRVNKFKLGISAKEASSIIGIEIKDSDIEDIFDRFNFEWKKIKPIDEVLKLSKTLVGIPYKRGASISYDAPKSFDCSGFVSYLFAQAGVQIPRICIDQLVFGNKIEEKDLEAGDIVFVNTKIEITTKGENYSQILGKMVSEESIRTKTVEFLPGTPVPEGVDHEGLYLGNGKIMHTSELIGSAVIEDIKESKYFKNIVGYRRMSDNNERFVITVPDERLDLRIKEDLAEEIGRIYGYEKIVDVSLPKNNFEVKIEKSFAYKEQIRRILYEQGFSEVMNYTFTDKGEIELANPMSPERKYLRTELTDGIDTCLIFNTWHADLIDMPQIKVFEFGHVFTNKGEYNHFAIGIKTPGPTKPKDKKDLNSIVKIISEKLGVPLQSIKDIKTKEENIFEFDFAKTLENLPDVNEYDFSEIGDKTKMFKKISQYPFMIRDIAVFTPEETKAEEVFEIIKNNMTDLAVRTRLFDVFIKTFEDGTKKTSYAYRIIFQSYEKTLSDEEVNAIMQKITDKMNAKNGWQVR
jgi:phenylalanyl-tRNA synthetase beta subunit